jgi:hypothetical protein
LAGTPSATTRRLNTALDSSPSSRKVRIALRQRHDRVQMIRKDYDGIYFEGLLAAGDAKGKA